VTNGDLRDCLEDLDNEFKQLEKRILFIQGELGSILKNINEANPDLYSSDLVVSRAALQDKLTYLTHKTGQIAATATSLNRNSHSLLYEIPGTAEKMAVSMVETMFYNLGRSISTLFKIAFSIRKVFVK
jgi:hypothetical protein